MLIVERNLGRTPSGDIADSDAQESFDANSEPSGDHDRVILGKLNRIPKALRAELSSG